MFSYILFHWFLKITQEGDIISFCMKGKSGPNMIVNMTKRGLEPSHFP